MGLKIGTIEADITANTSGLKRAEKEVADTTRKINKEMITTEKEIVRVDRALEEVGKEATKTADKFKFMATETKHVAGQYVRMNSAVVSAKNSFTDTNRVVQQSEDTFRKTGKAANDAGKAAKGAGKKVKGFGRNAGQAGIQFQQMVGQLQGGVSPFIAVSQQAADLGIVLGAPLVGVVVSLGAVLAGVLFNALMGSSEAFERAAASANDLSQDYLKLTGQAKELAAVKLSADMIKDAEAIVLLGRELSTLEKRRELALSRRRGAVKGKSEGVKAIEKEIAETENAFQTLVALNEFRARELSKFLAERGGVDTETAAPTSIGGQGFNALISEEIAALELRAKLFNDSDAKIEAEIMRFQLAALNLFEEGSEDFLAAEQALQDKRVELHEVADQKIADQNKRASDLLENQRKTAAASALNGMAQFGDQLNSLIEASGKEGSAIAKAIFLAQKAIQVAQILPSTEVAAAAAGAVAALGGPVPFFATVAAIRATGFASAGIVAGLAVGESFEGGGIVGGSSFTGDRIPARVNSGEMILNRAQQSSLFAMANGGGGGGQASVTIISNGTPQEVTGTQISRGEIVVMINDAGRRTEGRINASLSTGRGDTAASLKKGFKTERNIR